MVGKGNLTLLLLTKLEMSVLTSRGRLQISMGLIQINSTTTPHTYSTRSAWKCATSAEHGFSLFDVVYYELIQ